MEDNLVIRGVLLVSNNFDELGGRAVSIVTMNEEVPGLIPGRTWLETNFSKLAGCSECDFCSSDTHNTGGSLL